MGSQTLAVDDDVPQANPHFAKQPGRGSRGAGSFDQGDAAVSEMHDPFRIVIDLQAGHAVSASIASANRRNRSLRRLKRPGAARHRLSRKGRLHPQPPSSSPRNHGPGIKTPEPNQPPRAITDIGPLQPDCRAKAPQSLKPWSQCTGSSRNVKSKDQMNRRTAVANSAAVRARFHGGKTPLPAKTVPPGQNDRTASPPPAAATSESKAAAKSRQRRKLPSASVSRPAEPTSLGDRTMTRMLGLKIGRIVIDPGHGGHDLGTVGPGGLLEKDLVLSIALDLQSLLQDKLGAQVILTRSDDTFIILEERSAIANQFRADLFISIHANSSRSRSTSGVETYYLNFARTDAEREIASRENATSTSNISELEDLIKKIAQADKSTESKELASHHPEKTVFRRQEDVSYRTEPRVCAALPSSF